MKLLKEVYLSLFVLFYRIGAGQWPAYMDWDSGKGVLGVSIVQEVLAVTIIGWIETIIDRQLGLKNWMGVAVFVIFYCANYYVLIIKGRGVAFEKQFNHFEKRKRVVLYLAAIAVFLTTWVFFFLSAQVYHRTFNISPPTYHRT